MRFVIDEVQYQKEMTLVTGMTSVGTIKGIWKYREPPVVGGHYHVELSIYYPSETDILHKGKCVPSVYLDKDMVTFTGFCEYVDEEVYYLRFDIDWIEMLEISEIPSKKNIGDYISFTANIYGIEIYPYTL